MISLAHELTWITYLDITFIRRIIFHVFSMSFLIAIS